MVTVVLLHFPRLPLDGNGCLTFIESNQHVAFDINRIAYQYNVKPNSTIKLPINHCEKVLIAMQGNIAVEVRENDAWETYLLDNPSCGLHIPPGIEANAKMPAESLLMILFSDHFTEKELESYANNGRRRRNDRDSTR